MKERRHGTHAGKMLSAANINDYAASRRHHVSRFSTCGLCRKKCGITAVAPHTSSMHDNKNPCTVLRRLAS